MFKVVTVIYYAEESLELRSLCCTFEQNTNGRVVIPESFKSGKSIIAVCEGRINIINKVGDRIINDLHLVNTPHSSVR
ncbi:hypothetical protein tloyanaT_34850 [Thalassotalea loyana]|uniref:TIGR02922 family protein n=1 Tax=Thalassotalea loyana TaxID=280483 RepID=A0ABQ6HHV0_9GAMM|nr:TIGR02922 family protein [Thalassotalea loyana]GLX87232.1 hypothetical protein tloyanaT_34850 [Thalassotalea loyana]